MNEVEEVKAEIVKSEKDLATDNLSTEMSDWNKEQMIAYREKLRFAIEHGVLPANLIDDKVNHKVSEQKLDEAIARISYGKSLNMSPKLALTNTMIVNGNMTIWGDALPAVIYQSGLMDYKEETFDATTMTAICTIKRKDMSKPETRTFSAEDAKIAGLWGKNVWAKYPKRMLQQRARTYAFRDIFPDVLQGMITTEEAQEIANNNDVISSYSKVLATPVVKHVETVKEEVLAIEYTPLSEVQEMLQSITSKEDLTKYFFDVKQKVKTSDTSQLLELFRQRKSELAESEEKV
ncbi:recombinase RecT [Succinivibrio sp.]|uniref:recombinase RecT n=1 Tax=Succinivibrio sp. TaxID=2053619 RepID=UPI00386BA569